MSIEEAILKITQKLNLQTENDLIFAQKVSEKMTQSFSGYNADFNLIFTNKIKNTKQYSSSIEFHNIHFISYCKHHMSPIIGYINFSYIPNEYIIGFSRVIECINALTARLQLQESLTVEIAEYFFQYMNPKKVRVEIFAKHYCMQKSLNDALPEIRTVHEIING